MCPIERVISGALEVEETGEGEGKYEAASS